MHNLVLEDQPCHMLQHCVGNWLVDDVYQVEMYNKEGKKNE